MEYKFIICGLIILAGILVMLKSKNLALRMQSFYVAQAKKMKSDSAKWERAWILRLFRIMIIFFGFLMIIGAYPLLFGPYNA